MATQCLEVGAEFSFDALVTECASLDALRQRFGRLARLGADEPARAVILIRDADTEPKEPDAVYGQALAGTWKWLREQATADEEGHLFVDMGVEALEARVREVEDLPPLLAPSPDAPVLLPAHLDLLCQTAQAPFPSRTSPCICTATPAPPEVAVVWRCDLVEADTESWVETVALCPPGSGEMLQAPLWRVRTWLARRAVADDSADVEARGAQLEEPAGRIRPCLVWRGRDRSRVATRADEIGPGDVLVVPASYGIEGLGQATRAKGVGAEGLDLWEAARAESGQPPAVRLGHAALAPWLDCPPLKDLVVAAGSPSLDRDAIQEAVQAVLDYEQEGEDSPPPPPTWWLKVLAAARTGRIIEASLRDRKVAAPLKRETRRPVVGRVLRFRNRKGAARLKLVVDQAGQRPEGFRDRNVAAPLKRSRQLPARGLCQRVSANRAKSVSAETTVSPCSTANAARCASVSGLPRSW